MFADFSLIELMVILVVTLVVFGPEKIPDIARTAGRLLRKARQAGNMFRDMLLLEEDYTSSTASKPKPRAAEPNLVADDEAEPPPIPGAVSRDDGYRRPRLRPVLLPPRRRAPLARGVELAAATPHLSSVSRAALSPALERT